ncbi:MAG: hypothetical protein F7C32_01920 [Desulfurococcales archaeon]|nr:hypothetical protein [Desulfurococcales archaeon]
MSSVLKTVIKTPKVTVRYPDARVFQQIVNTLSEVLDDARFVFTPEGVEAFGFDPAKTTFIEVFIPASTFLEYTLSTEGEKAEVTLQLGKLKTYLKRGRRGDPVLLVADEENIFLEIEGTTIKRYVFHQPILPPLEESEVELVKKGMPYDAKIVFYAEVWRRVLRDAAAISDTLAIEAREDQFTLTASAEEYGAGKMQVKLGLENTSVIEVEIKNDASSRYELQMLDKTQTPAKIADIMELAIKDRGPIELVFRSSDNTKIRFIGTPFLEF